MLAPFLEDSFMSKIIYLAAGAGFAGLVAFAAPAAAQEACSSAPVGKSPFECLCAGNDTTGSIWGSNPYTSDSDLCTAAVHAGALGLDGGLIRVVPTDGQDSYPASLANGVQSREWGSYGTSILFEVAATAAAGDLPGCEAYPVGEASYACACPEYDGTGAVWGSGPYTADSSICVAAIHAGVIGAMGGPVLAEAAPGQDSYTGTEANGVATRDWGSYGNSFTINPKGPRGTQAAADTGGVAACSGFPEGANEVTCSCTGQENGAVWGSSPYTADSDFCAAARLDGVIDQSGGVVTVLKIGGLEEYTGSSYGGVESRDWGSYSESIIFNWN